jgi:hypothetical protein
LFAVCRQLFLRRLSAACGDCDARVLCLSHPALLLRRAATLSPVCHAASSPLCPAGRQYNEKIDVFSFGIILYELLSGVVLASRVAMQGQHEELLDYARQVANGHREAIPTHWPAQVWTGLLLC